MINELLLITDCTCIIQERIKSQKGQSGSMYKTNIELNICLFLFHR